MVVKKMKAKDLAKFAGLARACQRNVEFKVHRRGGVATLSDVRPAVTAKGNPSLKTIHLMENDQAVSFDGNYEFELADVSFVAVK